MMANFSCKCDPFLHLCEALFLAPSDYMQMLTCYCDDSGNDRVAVVAGYVSTVDAWKKFNVQWGKVLKRYKVPIEKMRRSDLENFKDAFAEEKDWNKKRRIAFLKELHPIIKQYTKVGVGSAVVIKDFEEIMPRYIYDLYGGPIGWAAEQCVVNSAKWHEKLSRRNKGQVKWIFEAGTKGSGQISKMFCALIKRKDLRREHRIFDNCSFEPKGLIPLHSADIIAYEVFKHVENQILDEGRKRGIRISMKDLIRPVEEKYFKCVGRAYMQKFADKFMRENGL